MKVKDAIAYLQTLPEEEEIYNLTVRSDEVLFPEEWKDDSEGYDGEWKARLSLLEGYREKNAPCYLSEFLDRVLFVLTSNYWYEVDNDYDDRE
jgi:hypothetical protein